MRRGPKPPARPIASGILVALCLLQLGCWKAVPLSDIRNGDAKELVGKRIRVERWPIGKPRERITLDMSSVDYPIVTGKPAAIEELRFGHWLSRDAALPDAMTIDMREVLKLEIRGSFSRPGGPVTAVAEDEPSLSSDLWVEQNLSLLPTEALLGERVAIEDAEDGVPHLVVMTVSSVEGSRLRGRVESAHRLAYGHWERLPAASEGGADLKDVAGVRIFLGEEVEMPGLGEAYCSYLSAEGAPGSLRRGDWFAVRERTSGVKRLRVLTFFDEEPGLIRGKVAETYTQFRERWGRLRASPELYTVKLEGVERLYRCTRQPIAQAKVKRADWQTSSCLRAGGEAASCLLEGQRCCGGPIPLPAGVH